MPSTYPPTSTEEGSTEEEMDVEKIAFQPCSPRAIVHDNEMIPQTTSSLLNLPAAQSIQSSVEHNTTIIPQAFVSEQTNGQLPHTPMENIDEAPSSSSQPPFDRSTVTFAFPSTPHSPFDPGTATSAIPSSSIPQLPFDPIIGQPPHEALSSPPPQPPFDRGTVTFAFPSTPHSPFDPGTVTSAVPPPSTQLPFDPIIATQTSMPGNLDDPMIHVPFQPRRDDPSTVDFDMRSIPSHSTSNLSTPTPGRPLRIPDPLESIIQRTVTEQLVQSSAVLVESTVRGLVDACIPRLEDLINARITAFVRDHPAKHSRAPNGGSGDNGWEGDDETDQSPTSPPSGRKKPGPRGHMNYLHSALRKYLTEKGVMASPSSKGPIPVALPTQVQAFNRDRSSPPVIENVAMDWTSPLKTSPWNQETVRLLAMDFQAKIKMGTYTTVVYNDKSMSIDALCRICEQKLSRTHQAFRQQAMIGCHPTGEQPAAISKQRAIQVAQQKNDRSMARKRNILARRQRIAQQNHFRDAETWDAVSRVTERLGLEGMSGDETDTPPGVYPKAVRRIEISWINPRISQLFHAVDSYESSIREENMRSRLGNAPLLRHYEPRTKNMRAKAISSLPRNWYDDSWFKGLSTGERVALSAGEDAELPTLASVSLFVQKILT
ncbi:hypothetical protein JVT61DRAFT_92 [Boletus reticuloceps]|uniref:Uncharacterized protein n=1 Tax=Boletus reticuloceps TaxID=495285 RepID=A0A8I2Z296_9AGAM|nr:hypothetical protein JVT61DRAFT_92 [Boletus reticuloceps]